MESVKKLSGSIIGLFLIVAFLSVGASPYLERVGSDFLGFYVDNSEQMVVTDDGLELASGKDLCIQGGECLSEATAHIGQDCGSGTLTGFKDDGTIECDSGPTWYEDADGDGYSDGDSQQSNSDPGADWYLSEDLTSTNSDCDDSDADVYPGQTGYFTSQSNGGLWDYNCDGSAEERWDDVWTGICVSSTTSPPTCSSPPPGWKNSVPSCGQTGQYILHATCRCQCIGGSAGSLCPAGGCPSGTTASCELNNPNPSGSSRTQACR
jgi:hypothetical protein